ncbi:MAG: alpha/beta hydrolase family protein [Polyangiaceae bacterium]|jgi:pimeloyl-ACP methyl ester carboxylesterase|nr:alpha/beta hydrolase family protein [Polyangiaceae bacterium]
MGYGQTIDAIVGAASRFMHVRGTSNNTVGDLGPYYDLPIEQLFPDPGGPPRDVRRTTPRFSLGSRQVETLAWTSGHQVLSPTYKRRHEGEYDCNLTAYARWMHPRGRQRRSILIYVHGWLEPGSWVEEATLMPTWYQRLGVDTAHVQLPFHGRRSPRGQLFHGEWFWSADLVRSLEGVRQALYDARSAMAYFRSLGYEEVGITGLSMGGSLTMLMGCLEPAPDYIVPMIAHLELADAVETAPILWRMKADLERFGVNAEQRRAIFDRLAVTHAVPRLAPDRQVWVAAREDAYLRAELVEKQWETWGRPPIVWLSCGHMTFPLGMGDILRGMDGLPRLGEPPPKR